MVLFAQTLGGLIDGGAPLYTALGIAARGSGNPVIRDEITAATEEIRAGGTPSTALAASRLDNGSILALIHMGEQHGAVGASANRAVVTFRKELGEYTKLVTTILEPVLIVGMAVIVAFIVFSMMVPILELEI